MSEQDTYLQYLRDIADHSQITPEKQAELFQIIWNSDDEDKVAAAKSEIVNGNLSLVVDCALKNMKYVYASEGKLSLIDLIAEGNTGLMKAVDYFGSDKAKFSTYAYTVMKQHIKRAFLSSKFVHIPEYHFKYWYKFREIKEKNKNISDEDAAKEMNISVKLLKSIIRGMDSGVVSLEDLVNDQVSDDGGTSGVVDRHELGEYLAKKMKQLKPVEQEVLRAVFFDGESILSVAKKHNVPRAKMDHNYNVALRQLRYWIRVDLGIELDNQRIIDNFLS